MTEHVTIEKPEGQYCFACGTANPIGLNLQFYRNDKMICSDITLGKYHEGWENIVHGGIISTLLDEVMSWTIMYFKRSFFVTRKMQVKYVRPVAVGRPLNVRGRLLESENPKTVNVRAELLSEDGKILARSLGEFVLRSQEELPDVPDTMKAEMRALFDTFDAGEKT
jgi:acyl-coenzyme A thioesterase PaaI-like protein